MSEKIKAVGGTMCAIWIVGISYVGFGLSNQPHSYTVNGLGGAAKYTPLSPCEGASHWGKKSLIGFRSVNTSICFQAEDGKIPYSYDDDGNILRGVTHSPNVKNYVREQGEFEIENMDSNIAEGIWWEWLGSVFRFAFWPLALGLFAIQAVTYLAIILTRLAGKFKTA